MIIICGPNHSGTSQAAKILLDSGFETKNYSLDNAPNIDYITYEDLRFKEICVELNKGRLPNFDYLKTLKGEKLFVKYPSAVLHLEILSKYIDDEIKVVFCIRTMSDNVKSFMDKTGHDKEYTEKHIKKRYDAIREYKGEYFIFDCDRLNVDELLEYLNGKEDDIRESRHNTRPRRSTKKSY